MTEEAGSMGLFSAGVETMEDSPPDAHALVSLETYGPELGLLSERSRNALLLRTENGGGGGGGGRTEAEAAQLLRDEIASALVRMLSTTSAEGLATLARFAPKLPHASGSPRDWSFYATAVLTASEEARVAAFVSTSTLRRLIWVYSLLEKAELRLRQSSSSSDGSAAASPSSPPFSLLPLTTITADICIEALASSSASSLAAALPAPLRMRGAALVRSAVTALVIILLLFFFYNDKRNMTVRNTMAIPEEG